MNYFDTLIEVADDCPTKKAQVPLARGGKKTKAVVEYEILVKHPYTPKKTLLLRRTPSYMTSQRTSGPRNARNS